MVRIESAIPKGPLDRMKPQKRRLKRPAATESGIARRSRGLTQKRSFCPCLRKSACSAGQGLLLFVLLWLSQSALCTLKKQLQPQMNTDFSEQRAAAEVAVVGRDLGARRKHAMGVENKAKSPAIRISHNVCYIHIVSPIWCPTLIPRAFPIKIILSQTFHCD